LPDEVSITHCLNGEFVEAVTGSLCQPLCETNYKTVTPLPVWKIYSTGYCEIDDPAKTKIEYKEGMDHATCRKHCELLSDCYFFVEYVGSGNRTSCSIWRANTPCNRLEGFRSGDQDEKNLVQKWHAYDGISDDGFQFMCDKDGVWNAEKLSDKDSAIEFFQRQCEKVTTTTSTTTTTPAPPVVKVASQTEAPDVTPIIAVSAGGAAMLILVVTIIVIVVCRRSNMESEKPSVVSDEEMNEVFKKTDDEEDGYVKAWMDGDKPATFDDNDDVPT